MSRFIQKELERILVGLSNPVTSMSAVFDARSASGATRWPRLVEDGMKGGQP